MCPSYCVEATWVIGGAVESDEITDAEDKQRGHIRAFSYQQ